MENKEKQLIKSKEGTFYIDLDKTKTVSIQKLKELLNTYEERGCTYIEFYFDIYGHGEVETLYLGFMEDRLETDEEFECRLRLEKDALELANRRKEFEEIMERQLYLKLQEKYGK